MKTTNTITRWLFGAQTEIEKELLGAILRDTDDQFLNWAIDKIVGWDNMDLLQNVTQIHGTHDKVLPLQEARFELREGNI